MMGVRTFARPKKAGNAREELLLPLLTSAQKFVEMGINGITVRTLAMMETFWTAMGAIPLALLRISGFVEEALPQCPMYALPHAQRPL